MLPCVTCHMSVVFCFVFVLQIDVAMWGRDGGPPGGFGSPGHGQ